MITQPIAHALFDKYYEDGVKISTKRNEDGSYEITEWVHPGNLPQPDEAQIVLDLAEYEVAKSQESSNKRGRKRQLLDALATLTGLTRKQVLKCFNEIVSDGNDD